MAQPAVTGALADWRRVGRRVLDRRLELGLGQGDLGVSKSVASNLENGRQTAYARSSLARVARSLRWTTDSIELILQGDEPRAPDPDRAASAGPATDVHQLAERIEELAAEVATLRRIVQGRDEVAPGDH